MSAVRKSQELFRIEQLALCFKYDTKENNKKTLFDSLWYLHKKIIESSQALPLDERMKPFLMVLSTANLKYTPIYIALKAVNELLDEGKYPEKLLQIVLSIQFVSEEEKNEVLLIELAMIIKKICFIQPPKDVKSVLSFFFGIFKQENFSELLQNIFVEKTTETMKLLYKTNTEECLCFILAVLEDKENTQTVFLGLECLETCLLAKEIGLDVFYKELFDVLFEERLSVLLKKTLNNILLLCTSKQSQIPIELGFLVSVLFSVTKKEKHIEEAVFCLRRITAETSNIDGILFLECFIEHGDALTKTLLILKKGVDSKDQTTRKHSLEVIAKIIKCIEKYETKNIDFGVIEHGCCLNGFKNTKKEGISLLNVSIVEGMDFLKKSSALFNQTFNSPGEALYFLCGPVDKKKIGNYLCERNRQIELKEFIKQFNFKEMRIDEALRCVTETLNVPGEAQQIERFIECFSQIYFEREAPNWIKTTEDAFILSFSIMMLNTDQHSKSVTKKMSLESYVQNLKGLNSKENFDAKMLGKIYASIKEKEFQNEGEVERSLLVWKRSAESLSRTFKKLKEGGIVCQCKSNSIQRFFQITKKLTVKSFEHSLQQCLELEPDEEQLRIIAKIVLSSCLIKEQTKHSFSLLHQVMTDKRRSQEIRKLFGDTLLEVAAVAGNSLDEEWRLVIDYLCTRHLDQKSQTVLKGTISLEEEKARLVFKSFCSKIKTSKDVETEKIALNCVFAFVSLNKNRTSVFWDELCSTGKKTTQKESFLKRLVVFIEGIEEETRTVDVANLTLQIKPEPETEIAVFKRLLCLERQKKKKGEMFQELIKQFLTSVERTFQLKRRLSFLSFILPTDLIGTEESLKQNRENQEKYFQLLKRCVFLVEKEEGLPIAQAVVSIVKKENVVEVSSILCFIFAVTGIIQEFKKLFRHEAVKNLLKNKEKCISIFKNQIITMLNKMGRIEELEEAGPLISLITEQFQEYLQINEENVFELFVSLCFSISTLKSRDRPEVLALLRSFVVLNYQKERRSRKRWSKLWNGIEFAVNGIEKECKKQESPFLLTEL